MKKPRPVAWCSTNRAYLRALLTKPSLVASIHLLRFFSDKCGVVIGGRLRWHFGILIKTARKVINVDNCPANCGKSTYADYVTDAADLSFAADDSLDFVCSSHVMEHLANPLRAIAEWKRVINETGIIYAGVPDKRYTFDNKRDRTPLSHLIDDFNKQVDQTDTTHIADFVEKWDQSVTHGASREQFVGRLTQNLQSQVHHHVWIAPDVKEMFEYMGLKVIYGPVLRHGTIHIIARKSEH